MEGLIWALKQGEMNMKDLLNQVENMTLHSSSTSQSNTVLLGSRLTKEGSIGSASLDYVK